MKEGILWKCKRFTDHEYEVIGFEERMHNTNVPTTNELGYTERSSHKAGLVPTGTLGALVLKHDAGPFRCGTGFTDEQRAHIWANRESLLGRMAKINSFEVGVKTLPRFPVFLDFRAEEDM
jgi:DNA ligase-1